MTTEEAVAWCTSQPMPVQATWWLHHGKPRVMVDFHKERPTTGCTYCSRQSADTFVEAIRLVKQEMEEAC